MIFRYPGGKGKLVKKFIDRIPASENFADVFVGGGSVALAVAARDKDTHVFLNDADPWVSNFWSVVVGAHSDFDSLINKVGDLKKPTLPVFKEYKYKFKPEDFSFRSNVGLVDSAFSLLFFNRTTFSGILSSGPIGGEDQETADWKVDARWNSARLMKELAQARSLLSSRTTVTNKDFELAIAGLPKKCFVYVDPPYMRKGGALYGVGLSDDGHRRLREVLGAKPNWLLSYDNCSEVLSLYDGFRSESLGKKFRSMSSQSDRPEDESELIIFSNEVDMTDERKKKIVSEKKCDKCAKTYKADRGNRHRDGKCSNVREVPANDPSIIKDARLIDFLTDAQKNDLLQYGVCEVTSDQVRATK